MSEEYDYTLMDTSSTSDTYDPDSEAFDPYALEGELSDLGYYDVAEEDQGDYFQELDYIYGFTDDTMDYGEYDYSMDAAGGYGQDEDEDEDWLGKGLGFLGDIDWDKWLGLGLGLLGSHMGSKVKPRPKGGRGGGGGGGAKDLSHAVAKLGGGRGRFTQRPKPKVVK